MVTSFPFMRIQNKSILYHKESQQICNEFRITSTDDRLKTNDFTVIQ